MQLVVIALAAAVAVLILFRMPGVFAPALAMAGDSRRPDAEPPGDEDEQIPETDRAPRRWLPWSVAAVAAVRLVLLLTLHA
jgi:hypothetical protein